jgi:flagellar basal-body rod modification protein FlgD
MSAFANSLAGASLVASKPADSTTQPNSGNSSSNSATITANDFLQLLVTEMQNQDPTSTTDPNEYINQLVQVNSLEQLISINQDLSGLSTASNSTGSNSSPSDTVGTRQAEGSASPNTDRISGNLSPTDTGGRATRIADALETALPTPASGSVQSVTTSTIRSLRSSEPQARINVSNPAQ